MLTLYTKISLALESSNVFLLLHNKLTLRTFKKSSNQLGLEGPLNSEEPFLSNAMPAYYYYTGTRTVLLMRRSDERSDFCGKFKMLIEIREQKVAREMVWRLVWAWTTKMYDPDGPVWLFFNFHAIFNLSRWRARVLFSPRLAPRKYFLSLR